MKLKIDLDACTGHGRCYSLAPELFDADEYGHSVLLQPDVPADQVDKARLAAANCPERAITVEE